MIDERVINYLKDELTGNEKVAKIKLLKKRGFLLDPCPDGNIQINDFLESYDNTELLKYVQMDVDEIVGKMFCRDSIIGHAVSWQYKDKWSELFASNRVYGEKVPTIQLEPFMAKLVHSLALCGMHTYFSCDGWHEESGRYKDRAFVGFLDRNSLFWFITLVKNDPDLKSITMNYKIEGHFITWYFTEKKRFEVYSVLDRIADILYQRRMQFIDQKKYVIAELKGKKKSSLSSDNLLMLLEETYKKCNMGYEPYRICNWNKIEPQSIDYFIENLSRKDRKTTD